MTCCACLFVSSGQYAAILVAFCGAVTSTFSLIGFCGLAKESRLLLLLHALLLLVIALTLVAAAIMCFVLRSNAEEYVRSHWNIISAKASPPSLTCLLLEGEPLQSQHQAAVANSSLLTRG